jgi:ArsR family transcriptional regulator
MNIRELTRVFKSLSDETRLRILNVLMERECCVCEVMQALQISQSRASRNLNALYNAGLLKLRRDGLWALYSIDEESLAESYTSILEAIKASLSHSKTAAEDLQRLKAAERIGPTCASKAMN